MTQTTDDRILEYLKDQSALDNDKGRRVKDIMTGISMDVENVRFTLHRMLGKGLVEASNASMIHSGVPAAFVPIKEQRESWRRDYIEPVVVWLGPTAKAVMAQEANQAKRDDDLHILAQEARGRIAPAPTPKPMDDYTTQVERLKGLMTSGATGLVITEVIEREYTQLRGGLLRQERFKKLAPRFVVTCSTLQEFMWHMQSISESYKGRREHISSEFGPLINSLFDDIPALDPVADMAQHAARVSAVQLPQDLQERGKEMAEVYAYLYFIENFFRVFIDRIKQTNSITIPTGVQQTIDILKKDEQNRKYLPVRGGNDLFYCDFDQLRQVMIRNWTVFGPYFPNKNEHWLNVTMEEVVKIRHFVAHNSYVGPDERAALQVNYKKIIAQLHIS